MEVGGWTASNRQARVEEDPAGPRPRHCPDKILYKNYNNFTSMGHSYFVMRKCFYPKCGLSYQDDVVILH